MNNIIADEYKKISDVLGDSLSKLFGKSILITGASGLIGSYMVDFLSQYDIKIYASALTVAELKNRFKNNDNVNFLAQNLNEPLITDIEFDYIIHAASNAHPLAFSQDPVGTMKTNLFGTMNLLEHAKKNGAKLLYLSTGEVYGNNTDHLFTENDLGSVDSKIARSCYPESKRAAETLCMSYAQQYDVKVNVARLCYIYGPTITNLNSRADAQFLRNALDGVDIVMKSKGEQKRTYCYVADAVSALLYILLNAESTEVYNVANPDSIVTVAEYAKILADIAGVNLRFELPNEIEAKGYSKQADSILSSQKLLDKGWRPFYDIHEGLKHTYQIKKDLQNA